MLNKILTLDRTDNEKPRFEGITSIIDKLQPLDIENFKSIVSFVDSVKIPQSCFLLKYNENLTKNIQVTIYIMRTLSKEFKNYINFAKQR